jgi:hypothetical protein
VILKFTMWSCNFKRKSSEHNNIKLNLSEHNSSTKQYYERWMCYNNKIPPSITISIHCVWSATFQTSSISFCLMLKIPHYACYQYSTKFPCSWFYLKCDLFHHITLTYDSHCYKGGFIIFIDFTYTQDIKRVFLHVINIHL